VVSAAVHHATDGLPVPYRVQEMIHRLLPILREHAQMLGQLLG